MVLVQTFLRHTLTDLCKGLLWRTTVQNVAFGTIISLLQTSPHDGFVHGLLCTLKGEQSRAHSWESSPKAVLQWTQTPLWSCKSHSWATAPHQSHCPMNRSVNHRAWASTAQRTRESKPIFVLAVHVYAVHQAPSQTRTEWRGCETQPMLTYPHYAQSRSWSFSVRCLIALISPYSQLQAHMEGDFDLQPTREWFGCLSLHWLWKILGWLYC